MYVCVCFSAPGGVLQCLNAALTDVGIDVVCNDSTCIRQSSFLFLTSFREKKKGKEKIEEKRRQKTRKPRMQRELVMDVCVQVCMRRRKCKV